MHAVYRLELHLPLENSVYFHGNADDQALKQAMNRDSKLTGWFKLNIADPSARHLLYVQIPYEFVKRDRSWHRRERQRVIPCLHTTNPRDRELFFFAAAFVARPWCHFVRIFKNCKWSVAPEFLLSS